MKASELRIGNKFHGIAGIQTVFAIMDNTNRGEFNQQGYEHLILVNENGNQYKPIEIEGIAITPDILKKCGFVNNHTYQRYWHLKEQRYDVRYKMFVMKYSELENNGKNYEIKIEYLHQLQNLYFALTGTELTITL